MKIQLTMVLFSSLAIAACGQPGQPAASAQEGSAAPQAAGRGAGGAHAESRAAGGDGQAGRAREDRAAG